MFLKYQSCNEFSKKPFFDKKGGIDTGGVEDNKVRMTFCTRWESLTLLSLEVFHFLLVL